MRKQRPFVTLDAETDPFKSGRLPFPFIWGLWNGKYFYQFRTAEQVIDFLKTKKVTVYAHNGGKFDYMFLLDFIAPWTRLKIIHGRLSSFKIGEAEFRDSFLILPVPLKAYKKDEISYAIFEETERYKPENWAKIVKYLEGDCKYLYELIEGFRNQYGKGLTLAGSAMNYWKKTAEIEIPKTTEYFYNTFKPFYHGGRVECFKKGGFSGHFEYVDKNSAYPEAMKMDLPWGADFHVDNILPERDGPLSRCFIELETESLGAFPFTPAKNKLSFPADGERRIFSISGFEYIAARDTGTLGNPKIMRVFHFLKKINFGPYVDLFYEKKKNAAPDSPERIYAKLFLNSLYGKWAANPDKYKEYLFAAPAYINKIEAGNMPEYEGFTFSQFVGDHALMERPIPAYQRRYYNVATGAAITGQVRANLWRSIRECKTPYYCDTDSIICEKFNGKIGVELGEWKVELIGNRLGIGGKKLYTLYPKDKNDKVKFASKGARLNPSDIMKVAEGQEIEYKPESPTLSLKRGFGFTNRKIKMTG